MLVALPILENNMNVHNDELTYDEFIEAVNMLENTNNDEYLKYLDETFDDFGDENVIYKVDLKLPKFEAISPQVSLIHCLKKLGVKTIFDNTIKPADDNHLIKDKNQNGVAVDDVIHQTFLAMNEKGTEAAAMTAVSIGETARYFPNRKKPKIVTIPFEVDHPFYLAIMIEERVQGQGKEKSENKMLFLGYINNVVYNGR